MAEVLGSVGTSPSPTDETGHVAPSSGYPLILNGDHAEFEREHVDTPPHERPDWPLPSFDAMDWAQAFCRIATGLGYRNEHGEPLDEAWMVGWFANALMRGFDEYAARVARQARATAPCSLSAEGVRDAGEASGQPAEPNPPIPLPAPGRRWTEETSRLVKAAHGLSDELRDEELRRHPGQTASIDSDGVWIALTELRAALSTLNATPPAASEHPEAGAPSREETWNATGHAPGCPVLSAAAGAVCACDMRGWFPTPPVDKAVPGVKGEEDHSSRAVPQSTISEGWQLVPTKHNGRAGLTHEMCEAFWRACDAASLKHGQFESTNAGYNAMLAAAPALPQDAETKEGGVS